MPRGGLGGLTYSGGRRQLTVYLDRETSAALDALAEQTERDPEAVAVAVLRAALIEGRAPST